MNGSSVIPSNLGRSVLTVLAFALVVFAAGNNAEAEEARHAGRLQHYSPADGLLVIEELGVSGDPGLLQVRIRDAVVVHLRRDPADPFEWRETRTQLQRWPTGTFIVVIGRDEGRGTVTASRVEIPEMTGTSAVTGPRKE